MGLRWVKKPKDNALKEFSKSMIKLYTYGCVLWITASYVLAGLDKDSNSGVTVAVISSLAAVLIGYFLKSVRENISKNRTKKDTGKEI